MNIKFEYMNMTRSNLYCKHRMNIYAVPLNLVANENNCLLIKTKVFARER